MLVGVISDTHDNLSSLQKAISIFKNRKIEMLIHCGDWIASFTLEYFDIEMQPLKIPVKSVIGNNQGDLKRTLSANYKMKNPIEWPKTVTMELNIDGKKTIIYHGDDYELLDSLIYSNKFDIIFTGHTHKPRNETIGKTLIINPGSTSYARKGKIIDEASIAIYDSRKQHAKIIYL